MGEIYRKRCKRVNTPGHAHFLTFSCFGRRAFLARDRARGWFVESLARALEKHEYRLWAWVIMPEHAHVLVHPRREVYSISGFLKSVKQPVTAAAVAYVKENLPGFLAQMLDVQPNGARSYRFWQRGGGYDTNLWTPQFIWEKVVYIHRNPVKRGLVKEATAWEWSSARDFSGGRGSGVLRVDREGMPTL